MRRPLTSAQLAELAEIPEEQIEEYRGRELIDPDGDGELDELDILRLRILMHYRSLGMTTDEIEAAIRTGSTTVLYSDLLWGGSEEFVTPEQVAESTGLPVAEIESILRAIGLSGTVPRGDLKFFETMKALVEGGMPVKVLLEVARVYGDTMRRLAQTEVRMIREFVSEPGRSSLLKERGQSERLQAVQQSLGPVLEPLLLSIHRRHLLRASVQEAVADLEAAEKGEDRETLDATIAFVDLASFTSLAQVHGDEVAAETLSRFDELVRELLEQHGGTLVKQIGDAAMLVFTEPAPAVRFAIGLDATAAREPNFPALRTGIHSGPVLYRVGDYVGNTVNLAAKITALADANEILVTEPVAVSAAEAGVTIVPAGERELAGIEGAVPLWRLERRAWLTPERDPVCGMTVGADATARLLHKGVEYAFCSHDCLRRFLEDPDRYVQTTDRASKPEL
jgi:class 3 adenylate cyclase